MYAYFDIENLTSFVKSSANERFADCNRMLKTHFDIKFNFPKKHMLNYPELMPWVTSMTQGAKGSVAFLEDTFPPRPLKSNTHRDFDRVHLSAVYLLNDEKMDMLMNRGEMLYAGVGSEVEVLSSLIRDDTDYGFVKQLEVRKMTGWASLDPHVMPTTDIIVVDQYLFSDDSIYASNVYSMIARLCRRINNAPVNIIFFTPHEFYNKTTKCTFTPQWGEVLSNIKKSVKAVTGFAPFVTAVFSSNLGEHDRTIFTNYQYLFSGDSYNYFDSSNKVITRGRFLDIKSIAHKEHFEAAFNFIQDMNAVLSNVISLRNPDSIKGDKKSLYLNF